MFPDVFMSDAKNKLARELDRGTHCPCCGQYAKRYKRRIHYTMAKLLIHFYRVNQDQQFMHYTDIIAATGVDEFRGGDFTKLQLWGLIIEKPKAEDEDKKASGYWKITDKGCAFVEGKVEVPMHAYIYNNRVRGFSDDKFVSIKDCLGKKFSYSELMGNL